LKPNFVKESDVSICQRNRTGEPRNRLIASVKLTLLHAPTKPISVDCKMYGDR